MAIEYPGCEIWNIFYHTFEVHQHFPSVICRDFSATGEEVASVSSLRQVFGEIKRYKTENAHGMNANKPDMGW